MVTIVNIQVLLLISTEIIFKRFGHLVFLVIYSCYIEVVAFDQGFLKNNNK